MRYKNLHKLAGFTLIEVMITVAIVGIIAAFALPNYTEYIRRSERLEARTTLFEAANWMERHFSVQNKYRDINGPLPILPQSFNRSPKTGTPKYDISVEKAEQTTYTLQAAPKRTDDKCGTFMLDESGVRSLGKNAKATVEECWR